MKNTNRIIVAFHTGRGGRFYNAGHVSFIGEKNFQELISINENNLFSQNRDEQGRFCKPFLVDLNGNIIVDAEDLNNEVGRLTFDGQYDSDYSCYLDECSENEFKIIYESSNYKSYELEYWMKENFINNNKLN